VSEVERIEIVASLSDQLPPIVRSDTVVVDHHLAAVLTDGRRVVDAGFGGVATSTLSAGGFTFVGGSPPLLEDRPGIALTDVAFLLRAELEESDAAWAALITALAKAGIEVDVQRLRAAPVAVDASRTLLATLAKQS
jgi:hypothetical protein